VDELGANPSVVDRWGGTPLDDAVRSGHAEVAAFLQSRNASIGLTSTAVTATFGPSAALCSAAARGDSDMLRLLVSQGLNIDQGDYDKRTALHLAASEGLLHVVKVLVDELGANPSVVDRWGRMPLDDAIRGESAQVASFLHSRGASLQSHEERAQSTPAR